MKSETERNTFSLQKVHRLIDANLNRLREGIRVLEDIQRFIFDNKALSETLKDLRHDCRTDNDIRYIVTRDILHDVLNQTTTASEMQRDDLNAMQLSNMKRAQESARVLEEAFKLCDLHEAKRFKEIRYRLYDLEKRIFTDGELSPRLSKTE